MQNGALDTSRRISLDPSSKSSKFPSNIISNHRYTPLTFLPLTLYHEFSYFFNLYFLLVALSQIIPPLRIGYLSTYIVPLVFVLCITLGKEASDDLTRRKRDAEANSEAFEVLDFSGDSGSKRRGKGRRTEGGREVQSREIRVGDVLVLGKDMRVPADVVVLKSVSNDPSDGETGGEAFIRTDQLDGETDWKLRVAPGLTQGMEVAELGACEITAGPPSREVNSFLGTLRCGDTEVPLGIDNTAWANTVVASNSTIWAVVVYTGRETRASMSTAKARSKTGLLEVEINQLTKILCGVTLVLSIVLVILNGTVHNDKEGDGKSQPAAPGVGEERRWWIVIMRFLILFSSIIPISLRVNLDMGKSVYARFIEKDGDIEGTIVRTSTIPEELGRVEYLLSDKTGTLTQNDMELKKIHVGTVSYAGEAMEEVQGHVHAAFANAASETLFLGGEEAPTIRVTSPALGKPAVTPGTNATRQRREIGNRVRDVVIALALCHNVTPTTAEDDEGNPETSYQASSPDEIAIIRWTESVGLRLVHRDRKSMKIASTLTGQTVIDAQVLDLFPFTSESKRMGIVVKFTRIPGTPAGGSTSNLLELEDEEVDDGEIWFFEKGADTVMSAIVQSNDWLDEETGNMAREGFRTLVVGRKRLTQRGYAVFAEAYKSAALSMAGREAAMARVVAEHLESELELLGVTGVEDKLQKDVKPSLELLRNAGIKIWMLTGDKPETARCVAVSSRLLARHHSLTSITRLHTRPADAITLLDSLRSSPSTTALLIDGDSLQLYLDQYHHEFISVAVLLPAVVACRCSPTQKAAIATLIREFTGKRICCIGDGGNDVSMILAADVGIGIVGREGRQASLAADFSITSFCHLTKLLVWHGRNSYKRSAKLAQFVIHRGLIISVAQTVFSVSSGYEPRGLYQGWLLVGYASLYTMFPVFSLVLDRDVDEREAGLYPELYRELTAGTSLSYKTFFVWLLISIYQGTALQGLSQFFVPLTDFKRMVSVGFTALIINELCMVALEITTWHRYMVLAEVGTFAVFMASVPLLGEYFALDFVWTWGFWGLVIVRVRVELSFAAGLEFLRC
ncbi:phospholipid-translocating P-type ATPase [Ascobolus immersus RN42]|uniref:Phospholipid-transporting ATPase n=1 Tax=Ascobolus immersus RN42 TaxID=1160509 RepID=A0A3N4I142_ASCIM|nr:phospholipid-translocating P-type ATPase [Ascobolus immersus RN42]